MDNKEYKSMILKLVASGVGHKAIADISKMLNDVHTNTVYELSLKSATENAAKECLQSGLVNGQKIDVLKRLFDVEEGNK